MTPYLKLPFSFDLARLQQELEDIQRIHQQQWVSHFNTAAYENNWGCIALRSVGGVQDSIIPVDGAPFEDTPLLAHCPYFQQVIARFECEKTSVRLMALAPGGIIKPHRDSGAALEDGITRLHIPIQTSPQVMFCIDGELIHFSAGDTWYLNASCEHSVENHSSQARVHLMLDCITNPWLEQVFAAAGGVQRPASPYGDASITDANVLQVIANLRAAGHAGGLRLAEQLQAINAQAINAQTTHAGRHPA